MTLLKRLWRRLTQPTSQTCAPCQVACNEGRTCPLRISERRQRQEQRQPAHVATTPPPRGGYYRLRARLPGDTYVTQLIYAHGLQDALTTAHAHIAAHVTEPSKAQATIGFSLKAVWVDDHQN